MHFAIWELGKFKSLKWIGERPFDSDQKLNGDNWEGVIKLTRWQRSNTINPVLVETHRGHN